MPHVFKKARAAHTPIAVPRYLKQPAWGPLGTTSGTGMVVILGPAAVEPTNYGSRTGQHSIPSLMRPLHVRDPGKWVAGHLLNDNMGGSGIKANNLTPLTQTANKQHAGYENRVKSMVLIARQMHNQNPQSKYWIGVKYEVKVSAQLFGDYAPYNRCPSHIKVSGTLVKVDKKTKFVTALPPMPAMQGLCFQNERVDNDDSHLI